VVYNPLAFFWTSSDVVKAGIPPPFTVGLPLLHWVFLQPVPCYDIYPLCRSYEFCSAPSPLSIFVRRGYVTESEPPPLLIFPFSAVIPLSFLIVSQRFFGARCEQVLFVGTTQPKPVTMPVVPLGYKQLRLVPPYFLKHTEESLTFFFRFFYQMVCKSPSRLFHGPS